VYLLILADPRETHSVCLFAMLLYNPINCGDGITAPIAGCGDLFLVAANFCRVCGRGNEPTILPFCARNQVNIYSQNSMMNQVAHKQ
jgi:hypothetical protein